jgi:ketosteroid isomerase-like protein
MPCRYTGRAEWEQMMRAWFGATFDSFAWSDVELHAGADPNRVFGTGKSRGVMKDGRVYENEYSWIFRLRDGRIVDYIEYFNPLNIIKTFGSQGDSK